MTVSSGVAFGTLLASTTMETENLSALLNSVDVALYRAKNEGRDRIHEASLAS